VSDLAASRAFYCDTLGLQVTAESDDTLWLRALEERGHHSMVLRQGPAEVSALSYKVWADDDLDRAADWLTTRDRPVEWVQRAWQGRTLRTSDLFGTPMEFYARMDRLPSIHQQYRGAKPLRIDHFNLFAPHVDEAIAFYGATGFRVTEYTEDEATGRLWAGVSPREADLKATPIVAP
jgi:catechol 2,3-dioxygenase